MQRKYTLEWIDALVTVTLNPVKSNVAAITSEQAEAIVLRLQEETYSVQILIKNQVFSLNREDKIELIIKQYHSALIILLNQACENRERLHSKNPLLKNLTKTLISYLDELLSFFEVRFSRYLSLDEMVPATYLSVTKKELRKKLEILKNNLIVQAGDKQLSDLVLNSLYSFINKSRQNYPVTFRKVLYYKELIKELEGLNEAENDTSVYSSLNRLLIYMNFNSKAFINYFTQKVAAKINSYDNIRDKIELLLLCLKVFKQLHRKPGVIFNPQYVDLKKELGNWFEQEIYYLEKKLHLSIIPLQGNTKTLSGKNEAPPKVVCNLSVDQMALVFRSADDAKVLTARSLNSVFKTIVPHLSSPSQENISYDSMRSKSYSAEGRDKEIVIQVLEQMIERIREY